MATSASPAAPEPQSTRPSKLAIIGAGSVGATVAYACLIRGSVDHIALHDLDTAKVVAQVKDLQHGLPYCPGGEVSGGTDLTEVCAEADIVAITAGAKQRPGESRLDLAGRNVALFRELIPKLAQVAQVAQVAPGAMLLVISNPVDVLTQVAMDASNLPRSRMLGSGTVLDSARFRALIAARLRVSPRNVHAYIAGEHGDSEIPLWSSATVGNVPLRDWAVMGHGRLDVRARTDITQQTRTAAAEIIAGKGATNYAIGLCGAEIVEALLSPTPRVLPVSAMIEEKDGLGNAAGVCLSVPRLISRAGVEPPLPISLSDNERAGLENSAAVLREALRTAE